MRNVLATRSFWATTAFTAAASLFAFLGPYNLAGPWKGIVAVGTVLVPAVQAGYLNRRAETPERIRKGAVTAARARVLAVVQSQWVETFLDPELLSPEATPRLSWIHGAVEAPFPAPSGGSPSGRPAPAAITCADLLAQASGSLLVLGPGGSGKTTLLVRAADELARAAEIDDEAPLPMPLLLSTWQSPQGRRSESFLSWLVLEGARRYRIPAGVMRRWLADGTLALLLDGLDEVPDDARAEAVAAFNQFLTSHGLNSVLVTSRTEQYDTLKEKLEFGGAVELEPLSPLNLPAAFSRFVDPAVIRDVLAADYQLAELFETPLMFAVAIVAFRRLPPSDLLATPAARRRELLFTAYVDEMVQRPRRLPLPGGDPSRFTNWLRWLAGARSDFSPREMGTDLLRRGRRRRLVTVGVPLVSGAAVAASASTFLNEWLALAAGFGSTLALIPDRPLRGERGWGAARDLVVAAIAACVSGGFALALSLGVAVPWLALVLTIAVVVRAGPSDGISRVERRNWFFYEQCLTIVGLAIGIAAALSTRLVSGWPLEAAVASVVCLGGPPIAGALGLLGASAGVGPSYRPISLWSRLARGRLFSIVIAPTLPVAAVLVTATHSSVIDVLPSLTAAASLVLLGARYELILRRDLPLQRIRVLTPLIGCAGGIAVGWQSGAMTALLSEALFAVAYLGRQEDGILRLKSRAVHVVLAASDTAPWRLGRFLDGATDRLLLRKVEGRYVFRHSLLREHFLYHHDERG